MNPNNPGTPEGSPEAANQPKIGTNTIEDLLIEGLKEEGIDGSIPEGLNRFNKDPSEFSTKLKVRMKRIYDDSKKLWGGISESDINDLSLYEINKQIIKISSPLVSLRSRFFMYAKDLYPSLRNSGYESNLKKSIDLEDRATLQKMLKNMRSVQVRRFISESIDIDITDTILSPREKKDISAVIGDIDSLGLDYAEKKRLKHIYVNWNRYNITPDTYDFAFILDIKKAASLDEKRDVLKAFAISLPLSFLVRHALINDDEIDIALEKNFGVAYSSLDTSDKQKFRETLRFEKANDLEIPLEDLSLGNLGKIFSLERDQIRPLVEAMLESSSLEVSPADRPEGNILEKAREKYPDIEDHMELFIQYVKDTIGGINGIHNLAKDSIIEFGDGDQKMRIRIIATHDESGDFPLEVNNGLSYGIHFEELPVENGYLKKGASSDLTLDAFYGFFQKYRTTARILKEKDFDSTLSKDASEIGRESGKIYDARDLDKEELNASNLPAKLDELDTEGRAYGFEAGTFFMAPEEEKDGKAESRAWKVMKVTDDYVEIQSYHGVNTERVSLDTIYSLAEAGRIKRFERIKNDQEFISKLAGYGVAIDAVLEDGQIVQKNKDEEGKDKKDIMRIFRSGSGGHIRIDGISDGIVSFGQYESERAEHEATEYAKQKGTEKARKEHYTKQRLNYGAFLRYLKEQKMQASSDDIIAVHDGHGHHDEHDHSHMEGSLWSRIGKMQNLSSLWKGLEMVWHSVEHTLEKGSKLDAARFAMKFGKWIPGDSIEAQLYADIVDGSKEITEKLRNKLNNLPGPKGRKKCIHIAHNKDARPEEVMAAIQYMVSGYGHLYAEDIKHYQSKVTRANLESKPMGYFAFLDAFIHSSRLPGGIGVWRMKAYEKAKGETGGEGEPPEEMLLHALFKSIDGNYDKYPYAASVVKAIGGPGGYEKDWKFEGTKNAMQKGRDQTSMVNTQGRLNKAVGYLATHEIYKGIGAMEKVAGKEKDPQFQAFPVVWAVGGYSKYASPTSLQDIKNYAENGFSFHAYAFMRRESDNLLYRETLRLAVSDLIAKGKMSSSDLSELNSIIERMDHGPEDAEVTEKKYGKESPPAAMMRWWQAHQGKGIHDMLQGHNGWLTKGAKNNETIRNYRQTLIGKHSTMLRDGNIPGTDYGKDWYDEHGLGMSLITRDSEDGNGLDSLYSNLNKIKFAGPNRGGRPMDQNNKEKIWDYVVKKIKKTRDVGEFFGDEDLQKEQFLYWRKELISFFNKELNAGEVKDESDMVRLINTSGYSYFQDLKDMGIDPLAVFKQELIEENAESDFRAWKSGGHLRGKSSSRIVDAVKGKTATVGDKDHTEKSSWTDPDNIRRQSRDNADIPYRNDD